jgi:hypothetical protein
MDHPIAFFALAAAALFLAMVAWRIRLHTATHSFLGRTVGGDERPIATLLAKACIGCSAGWLVYIACSLQGWVR